jgi:5-methylcytosine-specific restriction endonuclease McrA
MSDDVKKLAADDYVTSRKGIFEFLLGGSVDTKLLEVRVFETPVKRAAYAKQTQAAQRKGESNCPLCAVGHNANKNRIYKFDEMDADHVSAWSEGGKSSAKNCEMLCITHNRAKGNR